MKIFKWIAGGTVLGIAAAVIITAGRPVDAQRPDRAQLIDAEATADMLRIRQVIAEYSYTFDSRNSVGWSELFTDDAVWEFIGPQDSQPLIRLEGRDEILDWARTRHREIPENISSYHHQSGMSFESLTPNTARTRVMVLISSHDNTQSAPRIEISLVGIYHDEWVKTSEGWKFARRTLKG